VSVRAFNHPYDGAGGVISSIPLANAAEKEACAIHYSKVVYDQAYIPAWEFA
jgi:hypothetical protein